MSFESYLTTAMDRLSTSKVDWYYILYEELMQPYIQEIDQFITDGILTRNAKVEPDPFDLFTNLSSTPCHATRVVIVNEYPYPIYQLNSGRALDIREHPEQKKPGTLRNVHRELKRDLKIDKHIAMRDSFFYWAIQGVLLLNNVWTCEVGEQKAHKDLGWQQFTQKIIKHLNSSESSAGPLVFIFIGNTTEDLKRLVKKSNLVLEVSSPHPSTALNGFMFSSIFSKSNEFLRNHNRGPIDWEAIKVNRYGIFK